MTRTRSGTRRRARAPATGMIGVAEHLDHRAEQLEQQEVRHGGTPSGP